MPATYEPIATTTLGSAANTIVFNSIPNTFTDLRVVLVFTTSTAAGEVSVRFNGNTSTLYSRTTLSGDGTSASSVSSTGTTRIAFNWSASASATIPTAIFLDVFSYAGSTNKTCLWTWNADQNGSGGLDNGVGLFRSTTAISSITLTANNNFAANSTATLYGIKAA